MAATVLCVDDDRNLCQIIAKALGGEGYRVLTAFDDFCALCGEFIPDEAQPAPREIPTIAYIDRWHWPYPSVAATRSWLSSISVFLGGAAG